MRSVFKTGSLLTLLLCLTTGLAAEKQAFTRSIKKQLPLTDTGTFKLENQYGDIVIDCWQQENIRLEVTIRVEAASERTAQRYFEQIEVDIRRNGDAVTARTLLNGGWNWFNEQADFAIDYRVWMPQGAALDLTNQYGDAKVCELARNVDIELSYGDLELAGAGERLDLELSYGEATVQRANDARLDVRYATFELGECRQVELESAYSKLKFGEVGSLRTKSRYDRFEIGQVRDFDFEGRYGEIKIDAAERVDVYSKYTKVEVARVADRAELDMHYGGAQLDRVEKGFSTVNLVGRYANYRVEIDDDASYQLNGETEHCRINVPAGLQVSADRREGASHRLTGHQGVAGARSTVQVKLNYGGIQVE